MKTRIKDGNGDVIAVLEGAIGLEGLPCEAQAGWLAESYLDADDVRAEASRRMQAAFGARDADHLAVIISNASREAIRLLRIGSDNWTAEQTTRAAQLEGADQLVEAIRAASNAMESDPPSNYADDSNWP